MLRLLPIAFVLTILISGCSSSPSEVGISDVRVYPDSKLKEKDVFYARVGDSLASLEDVATTTWDFKTGATLEELKDFYASAYPNAEQDEDPGDPEDEDYPPSVVFWIPSNNPEIDELTIEIYDGGFVIAETVFD